MKIKETIRAFLPRFIKAHSIHAGQIAGARIVTSWHDYPGAILGTTERPLLEWFSQNVSAGETWLDIGAHYGYTAIALSKLVGAGGRVLAFEPVQATAACIEETRKLNGFEQLEVLPFALGRHPQIEMRQLPEIRGMADSTISRKAATHRIMAISLDALWPLLSAADESIDGIKIDVQGMEFEVLLGMDRVLRTYTPKLVIEFHRGVDRNEITRFLQAHGYSTACRPVDESDPTLFHDDTSYIFEPQAVRCAS